VFDAEVKPIDCEARLPHMGFNKIYIQRPSVILTGLDRENFYFMHSYEVVNYKNIVSLTKYQGHDFVSAIEKSHIFGVQFHPEKSREQGLEVFKNFLSI